MSTIVVSTPLAAAAAREEPLYEVINGQRVELPPMSIYSIWVASCLISALGPFVRQRRLGRVVSEGLFILDSDKDLRRRPDLAFVSAESWPLERPLPETGDWALVPDLAIEAISPNDVYEDVLAKMREYFQYGVRQVWIISPRERQLAVFDSPYRVRILSATEELTDTVVPEFTLKLAELFQQPA
jgi:Uma2 family endonuclease